MITALGTPAEARIENASRSPPIPTEP